MVEHQIVDLAVAGSSPPVFHPNRVVSALVAQLDRAPDFESVGRRFESFRAQRFGFFEILLSWAASSAGRAADS